MLFRSRLLIEAAVCGTGLVAGTLISFNSWYVCGIQNYPLAYLPFPFLVWGALRFGQRGATAGTLLVSALAIYSLRHGTGPFVANTEKNSLMLMGSYIGILAVTNLLLAAAAAASRAAERAVSKSEKRFRAVVEDQTDLICRFNPDGCLTFVNEAFCHFHGQRREQLLGTNFFETLSQEDAAIPLSYINSLPADEPMVSFDYRLRSTDEQMVWHQYRIRRLFQEQGETREFQAVIQDITQRKRSENALRKSEERFRSYFELGLIGIAVTSPYKACLEVNDELCRILGYDRNELLQMSWTKLTHPDDLAAEVGQINQVLAGECDGYSLDKRFIRKDGQIVHATVSVRCVRRTDGSVDYLLALLQDVTKRKRLEAQLLQSQKMETVGKLAGGVAHEFNSLLTAIIGQSDLLLRDLLPGNPLCKNATEIRKAADRAATLTRQLLAYGRKQILQPKILNLNTVLVGMENTLRHLLGRNTDVRVVPTANLGAVKADIGQIEQVIMNLVMNAADAMPNGGKLTLETANILLDQEHVTHFSELKAGDYVMFAISDTGIGMTEEIKARIFEPFFTTKNIGQGTGLGLSTCYGIVKQSGGHISVYSELGRGTTFKVYLPQVELPAKLPALPSLDTPELPRGTETILLVEDNPALRELATTLLQRLGYTVLAAADGIAALSRLNEPGIGKVDLLFTDVVMPHLSGQELAAQVQALSPPTRILFTSAYTANAIFHQGLLAPDVALLQKPFTPSALANKLRAVLDQPAAPPPAPKGKLG